MEHQEKRLDPVLLGCVYIYVYIYSIDIKYILFCYIYINIYTYILYNICPLPEAKIDHSMWQALREIEQVNKIQKNHLLPLASLRPPQSCHSSPGLALGAHLGLAVAGRVTRKAKSKPYVETPADERLFEQVWRDAVMLKAFYLSMRSNSTMLVK